MKRILILVTLTLFLCSTASAGQGGGGESTKGPAKTTRPKPKPKSPPTPASKPRDVKSPRTRAPSPPPAPLFGDITIVSEPPDCLVLLNGEPRGSTSQEGSLTLSNLKPGRYNIILRKPTYRDSATDIDVIAGEKHEQRFALDRMPGKLNVSTTPGAQISISGKGSYDSSITDLELAAGSYEVTVAKPGFHTATHTVLIEPEKPVNLSLPLEPVSSAEILAPIESDFTSRRYANVIQAALPLLESISDKRGRVNFLIGMSYFNLRNYNESVSYLSNAIASGETLTFDVKRYVPEVGATGNVQNSLWPGKLILQKDFFEFSSSNFSYNFRVSTNRIYTFVYGDVFYSRDVPTPHIVVKVGIPKNNNKEEQRIYNFQPNRARMTSCQGGRWCASCPDCQEEAKAIYQLIAFLKEGGSNAGGLSNVKTTGQVGSASSETVRIAVKHEHRFLLSHDLCSGNLILENGFLEFSSFSNPKENFRVPVSKIYELAYEEVPYNNLLPNVPRIHMKIGISKDNNKEDKKNYNFLSERATMDRVGPNNILRPICPHCEHEVGRIYRLISAHKAH